ncbi:hypothetical protein [Xanthomonas cannabis]|uniref:hypothetical protein n=1 Tax=Xanthomonas cannabis TaxID=1885674 RepID=UPI0033A64E72
MERADHHAGSIKEIALALTGAIIWRKYQERRTKNEERRNGVRFLGIPTFYREKGVRFTLGSQPDPVSYFGRWLKFF